MEHFVRLPGVVQVIGQGETKSSVIVSDGRGGRGVIMNADLRVVSDEQFPFALHYFTGSKDHNIAMRQRAIRPRPEAERVRAGRPATAAIACKDEADLFRALGAGLHPAGDAREHRRDRGGRGAPRCRSWSRSTTSTASSTVTPPASDGGNTLEEMAEAARRRWACSTSASAIIRNR